jgi:2-amino-4-hydroxy-6-hydroxymethyldihydropteridine diphosphokinase
MADVLIALGGNVGDVRDTFEKAILSICDLAAATLVARSADYLTPPWGDKNQPSFVNACIRLETFCDPHRLLNILHQVERVFGRDRSQESHWGPRTLDLDILAYADLRISEPALIIPHPRLFERAFVLVPLAEIAPDRAIGGQTPRQALAALSIDGIQRLPDRN